MAWSTEYCTKIPYVMNAMTLDSFHQMRRFIHLVNTSSLRRKGHPKWHPLQKVQPMIDIARERLQAGWTLGKRICVDESMIKHMGKHISFVQHMPKKPTRHGLKVWALCDSVTGYLCNFEVCTGQGNVKDGTPKEVIHRLIGEAGLAGAIGRILHTDNFCTSREVMLHVYLTFGFLMVGTYALTKKEQACSTCVSFRFFAE